MSAEGDRERASHQLPAAAMDPVLKAHRDAKVQVSMIGLCGCWGCTLSFLDIDERLLPLLERVSIHRSSLTDIKRITTRCAIGFVEGGVANEENIETLRHFRENCDVLISVGACAIWGGVPAMRNFFDLKDCLAEAYLDSPTAVPEDKPIIPFHPDIPRINTSVLPCHEVVKMDYFIPGCPPDADAIFTVLNDLLDGRTINLPRSLNQYD